MSGIPLCIAGFTGRYQRNLRRYRAGTGQDCAAHGYHDAIRQIGEVSAADHIKVISDDWPHDDPRWPAECDCGSYRFTPDDRWQRNDARIFRLPDGAEFHFWGSFGRFAPPGTMIRADWYDEFSDHPGHIESWLIALPDGGEWITSQRASGGGYWTVTGTPPKITASPSVFHNAPTGWHGFVRDGELVPA